MKQSAESSTICCAELSVLIGENETLFLGRGWGGLYRRAVSVFFFWLFLMLKYFIFVDEWVQNHEILLFWQVKPVVHVFQVSKLPY